MCVCVSEFAGVNERASACVSCDMRIRRTSKHGADIDLKISRAIDRVDVVLAWLGLRPPVEHKLEICHRCLPCFVFCFCCCCCCRCRSHSKRLKERAEWRQKKEKGKREKYTTFLLVIDVATVHCHCYYKNKTKK